MLQDKVIVITGGAGLIGKELATAVVESNGTAIIADIDLNKAEKVKNQISKKLKSDCVDFVNMDVTSKDSTNECLTYVYSKYKRIDALVNNAYPRNKSYGNHFFEVDYQDFVDNVSMNLGGYFLSSQIFAKFFQKQGYGNIVNISSIYGLIAPRFEIYKNTDITVPIEYSAIKAGLLNLNKYMAKYLKDSGIRVNAISPGGILDNQPKEFINKYNANCLTKGMLNANDLNGTLVYLLSDMSSFVNGQNIIVDDGFVL
jgi:NAD(P)-dependent dehydrogenase (short-subunit alcohol dehydrogenase family)